MKSRSIVTLLLCSVFTLGVAQDYKFGKVSKDEILQKEHPRDPSADAAVLFREIKTEFQYSESSGWNIVTDYFERVKIYNKEGFEWANVIIDLYKGSGEDKLIGLKGYTYYLGSSGKVESVKLQKDGIFNQETTKYLSQTKITMPDVREGCVVEYRYKIESPFIFNIDEFRFQEMIPVEKVDLLFKSPEYFVFKNYQRGWVPFKIETDSKDKTLMFSQTTQSLSGWGNAGIRETSNREVKFKENSYIVRLANVPAMKEEAYAGNMNNYTTALQFEVSYTNFPGNSVTPYSTTWEDVSKNIYKVDLFGAELERTNYFEKDIDALLAGVSKPEEKVERIFHYLVNKMAWNKYNGYYTNEGVKNAYKKGSGNAADINLMLTAMLRYANLNANPVLVSTKSNGIPLFPTRNGFNYVVSAVDLPTGTVLLDATHKDAEIGILRTEIMNGDGRMIKKEGVSSWISLRPTVHAVKNSMVNFNIQPDLSVSGIAQHRVTGNYAFQYRSKYKNIMMEDQRKALEKNYKQTELSDISFENLEKLGEPVSLKYNFELVEGVENVGGKVFLAPMGFLATNESPFKSETREYPIDFGFPIKDRYIVNISIPEGFRVESLPEDVVLNLGKNMGSYKYLITQMGDKLQLSVELAINESFIAAQEYGSLKKFFELMVAKENEKVVLTKV